MTLDISFFTAERADADVDQWRRRNVDHDRHDHDMGTPPADRSREGSPATVPVNIDGQDVLVPEGTSVMRAAAICGVDIPKLCATDSLDPFGSCRLCVVEIDGRRGTPASCTTPVAPGMSVTTQSPKLERLRRGVMELYISDHPLDCLTCAANGDCELQDMAGAVGLREVRYGSEGDSHLGLEKDTSNPYFTFDSSKCIVCSRCVRACEEVQGTFALTIEGRGFGSRVAAGANGNFFDSACVSCELVPGRVHQGGESEVPDRWRAEGVAVSSSTYWSLTYQLRTAPVSRCTKSDLP